MTREQEFTLQRALAVLIVLPALVLAWPFGPLRGDAFVTELSATGWTAILLLPAAAVTVLLPRGRVAGLGLLLGYWLWATYSGTRSGTDSLERDRALMMIAIAGVSTIAGSSLGDAGRRALAGMLVLLSLLTSVATLMLLVDGEQWAGPLGNSGETACVLVPGALIGAVYAARRTGLARAFGALTFALALTVTTAPPSLTALAALAGGLGLGCLVAGPGRRVQAGLAGVALLCLLLGGFARPVNVAGAPSMTAQSVGSASGLAVRRLVWPASTKLVAANPLFGVGAGQFAARFPEVRDPAEIELSSHNRKITSETQVSHPHTDWLLPFIESGVPGGLLFGAFLLLAAFRALSILRRGESREDGRMPLAVCVLGALVLTLFWYPLTYLAVAAVPLFAAMGALLAAPLTAPTSRTRRTLPIAAALLLALFWPRAVHIVKHGRALASIEPDATAEELLRGIEAAQAECADSLVALSLRALYLRGTGRPDAEQRSVWLQIYALQPARLEALMSLGNVELRLGDEEAALEWFERARAIDPYHPSLLMNLTRLAYYQDDPGAADSALDDLVLMDRLDTLWLSKLGAELLLDGRLHAGQRALARADQRFAMLTPETCIEYEREFSLQGERDIAEGFESLRHTLWAREHAAAEHWDDCRRSLRQALRITRMHHAPAGPVRTRLELAAALYLSQKFSEADELLNSLEPTPRDWLELPDWAGQALLNARDSNGPR